MSLLHPSCPSPGVWPRAVSKDPSQGRPLPRPPTAGSSFEGPLCGQHSSAWVPPGTVVSAGRQPVPPGTSPEEPEAGEAAGAVVCFQWRSLPSLGSHVLPSSPGPGWAGADKLWSAWLLPLREMQVSVQGGRQGRTRELRLGESGARSPGKRACAQRLRDKHQFAEPGNRALPNSPKPKQSRCKGIEA